MTATSKTLANIVLSDLPENTEPLFLIQADGNTSYATYFNAFPASYWQNNTRIDNIQLRTETSGAAIVRIFRSDSAGNQSVAKEYEVHQPQIIDTELPLSGFDTGGWYWFEISNLSSDFTLHAASWRTTDAAERHGTLSIGITTMNKPDFCIQNLNKIALNTLLMQTLDTVYVVDQGTDTVRNHENFMKVQELFGNKLQVIEQENLGGSGGFSRSMLESLHKNSAQNLLLLDDDVEIQAESILRAHTFSGFTLDDTVVGGHMFDLKKPTVLHAFSEIVEEKEFFWTQRDSRESRHDFMQDPLATSPWLHRYLQADFNGWWMCLIPLSVLARTGLSLPYFIKWDDAEFGLRAKSLGIPTISLPGVALWHISWLDKDDAQDWQAFYHTRNRFISALIHSAEPLGGRLISSDAQHSLKHLMAMHYYSVTLRNLALKDVLKGPSSISDNLSHGLQTAQRLKANFPENRKHGSEHVPDSQIEIQQFTDFNSGRPSGWHLAFWLIKYFPRHYLRRNRVSDSTQVQYPKLQATWWRVAAWDSYIVESSAQDGFYQFTRNQKLFRTLLKESNRLHRELRKRWKLLATEYRKHAPMLSSTEHWESIIRPPADSSQSDPL